MHGNCEMPYRCMSAARDGLAEPEGPDLARPDRRRAPVGNRPRQSANGRDRMGTPSVTAVECRLSFSRRTTARVSFPLGERVGVPRGEPRGTFVTRDTTKASSVALDVPPRVGAERGAGQV